MAKQVEDCLTGTATLLILIEGSFKRPLCTIPPILAVLLVVGVVLVGDHALG